LFSYSKICARATSLKCTYPIKRSSDASVPPAARIE
jgi:hypothetical protein